MKTPKQLRMRSGRTPLQLKNCPADPTEPPPKAKSNRRPCLEISARQKEKNPIPASLAEELSAMKKKLERMRGDRERTEKMLEEKQTVLDANMKEIERRGLIQKNVEIEVDRLFRLKELKRRCMRVSPMRTLRDKEREKSVNQPPFPSLHSQSHSQSFAAQCLLPLTPPSLSSLTQTPHTISHS
ncbi:hypothetical protein Fmac_003341 [Flemingia macrophylla]|uniref:Uncharacterized protein n=1 Tax=Flemingia macrophylla TaxID=520843 RepID=A0ABD1NMM3_9FABA